MNISGNSINQAHLQQRLNGDTPAKDLFNRQDVIRHYNSDGTMVTENSINPNQSRVRATTGGERLAVQQANAVQDAKDDPSKGLGLSIDTYA